MQTAHTVPQPVPQGVQWQVVAPPEAPPMDTQTTPKQRKGATARMITGVIQAFLGLILFVCGIVVFAVNFPDTPYDDPFLFSSKSIAMRIDNRDRQAWAIWIGLIVIVNSIFGILSKRNQVVISLYMAISIFLSVVTIMGIVPVSVSMARAKELRNNLSANRNTYTNPCTPESRYSYDYVSISAMELERQEQCTDETISAANLHFPIHCISLICLVIEFIVAIIAASFTCVGLKCCCCSPTKPNQRVVYYQAQIPQFQNTPPFIIQDGPPPPYQGQAVIYPAAPVGAAAGEPLPPGGPTKEVAPSPVPQQPLPPDGLYLTPDVTRAMPTAPATTDNPSYMEPDAAPQRPLPTPGNQEEYAYADTEYRPAPPPYENNARHLGGVLSDQHYVTITG